MPSSPRTAAPVHARLSRFRPDTGLNAGLDELRITRETLREAGVGAARWNVTGYVALQDSTDTEDDVGASVLVEALGGAGGALVVLAFVFASFSPCCRC